MQRQTLTTVLDAESKSRHITVVRIHELRLSGLSVCVRENKSVCACLCVRMCVLRVSGIAFINGGRVRSGGSIRMTGSTVLSHCHAVRSLFWCGRMEPSDRTWDRAVVVEQGAGMPGIHIHSCYFTNNSAAYGGVIYAGSGALASCVRAERLFVEGQETGVCRWREGGARANVDSHQKPRRVRRRVLSGVCNRR